MGRDIDVMTYQAAIKSSRKYRGKIIDEVHHLHGAAPRRGLNTGGI